MRRLLSAKNLDLVSLTICSCVLTILFHAAANLPQPHPTVSNTASHSANAASPVRNLGFQPYTLTAAKPETQEEEEG
ncbi:MAG TPA: hypothetical protein IGS37_18535 [Synechococcales cyanobacterium M55_K2018_004]|nr:hypothetical protein [Synechococcales cyanobacterium M55_K2018_004]